MPRNVWAKVYCDLLRHPKIIGRPDSDVRLFLGLILYAKEYAPETGLVALAPGAMREVFGIKASVAAVKAALAYFVTAGVLVAEGAHVRIRDFATRQAADSAADRMARWRDNKRDGTVTKRNDKVTSSSPDVEGEVEEEKEGSDLQHAGEFTPLCEQLESPAVSETKKNEFIKAVRRCDGSAAIAALAPEKPLRKAQEAGE